jgi:protease I
MSIRKPPKRAKRAATPPIRGQLSGYRVAILATDGFEQSELFDPKRVLEKEGAGVDIVAPAKTMQRGRIRAWNKTDWGKTADVTKALDKAKVEDYDALVLPGGVINPDRLRLDDAAVAFIRDFASSGKPLAAICHGPQLLIEADLARDKRLTSWPSLRTDLVNAGAQWVDEEVVADGNLVTSRKPEDIPAFTSELIGRLGSIAPRKDAAAA